MAQNRRLTLHQKLKSLGARKTMFQPASNAQMEYPAIVYKLKNADSTYADNKTYKYVPYYEITIIDKDPDSELPRKLAELLPMIKHVNQFVTANLYHNVFNLYF